MKKIYAFIIVLAFMSGLTAQECIPVGITFTRQSQVDSFPILYPDCLSLDGFLVIGKCAGTNITSLESLSQLTSISRFVHIYTNDLLPDLYGLHNIKHIGGDLIIGTVLYGAYCGNDSLLDMTGLNSLESIDGRLVILGNEKLQRFSGLENLKSVNGAISIQANNALFSLEGLENINADGITELYFINNPSLSGCDIESICDFLYEPGADIEIHQNASGCSSPQEAAMSCGLGLDDKIKETKVLQVYPNPAKTSISIDLPAKPGPQCMIFVYSIRGEEVMSHPLEERTTNFDISNLPEGMYVVKVLNDDGIFIGRFIKE